MNRNAENHFALTPQIEKPRSIFDRSNQIKTSFNIGKLIPIELWTDVMPGDTVKIDTSTVARLTSALKTPVMDNAYLDYYYFFVSNRLVWEHWEEFMGENDDPWAQTIQYQVPQLRAPAGGWKTGTLADYIGIPTNIDNFSIDAMPLRAYCKIWNDYFRDQNSEYALKYSKGDTTEDGVNTGDYTTDCQLGGMPAPVNRFHDYFSSCLPQPYKTTEPVTLPLGQSAAVIGTGALGITGTNGTLLNERAAIIQGNTTVPRIYQDGSGVAIGIQKDPTKSGLIADLSTATAATINQLYQAFAINKMYYLDGVGGSRYNELIKTHFGVNSPDARLQRAEYLGGKRIALNIQQVEQQSSNTESQFLGSLGAYSQTADTDESFTYSAQEYGMIFCVACVRTERSYQQGLNRQFSRLNRTDYYFPVLANIGEQAVLTKEIYLTGNEIVDNSVFGYQEAWADLRYKPSRVSGQMRSNATGTLDTWHYADYYNEKPVLSPEWLYETEVNMDRTLAVTSETTNQVLLDIYFDSKWTREMPLYSIPGLPA